MASWGTCDCNEIKKLQKQIEAIENGKEEFCRECANELAQRLLAMVKQRTPVGDYSGHEYQCKTRNGPSMRHKGNRAKGLTGGTLRKNWTTGEIQKNGGNYEVEIINLTEYTSYVEYGHRTSNHKGWVPGHFMMTISENKLKSMAPELLEKYLAEYLRGCLNRAE